ncbi:hypothetical protein [Limnohabitans sp.]|nr:hypothetical protein [Limnohabitans sp.]
MTEKKDTTHILVIVFILLMTVYFLRVFFGLMDETGKSTHK